MCKKRNYRKNVCFLTLLIFFSNIMSIFTNKSGNVIDLQVYLCTRLGLMSIEQLMKLVKKYYCLKYKIIYICSNVKISIAYYKICRFESITASRVKSINFTLRNFLYKINMK